MPKHLMNTHFFSAFEKDQSKIFFAQEKITEELLISTINEKGQDPFKLPSEKTGIHWDPIPDDSLKLTKEEIQGMEENFFENRILREKGFENLEECQQFAKKTIEKITEIGQKNFFEVKEEELLNLTFDLENIFKFLAKETNSHKKSLIEKQRQELQQKIQAITHRKNLRSKLQENQKIQTALQKKLNQEINKNLKRYINQKMRDFIKQIIEAVQILKTLCSQKSLSIAEGKLAHINGVLTYNPKKIST